MQWIIPAEYSCAAENDIAYIMTLARAKPYPETLDRRVMLALNPNPRVELVQRYLRRCILSVGGTVVYKSRNAEAKDAGNLAYLSSF